MTKASEQNRRAHDYLSRYLPYRAYCGHPLTEGDQLRLKDYFLCQLAYAVGWGGLPLATARYIAHSGRGGRLYALERAARLSAIGVGVLSLYRVSIRSRTYAETFACCERWPSRTESPLFRECRTAVRTFYPLSDWAKRYEIEEREREKWTRKENEEADLGPPLSPPPYEELCTKVTGLWIWDVIASGLLSQTYDLGKRKTEYVHVDSESAQKSDSSRDGSLPAPQPTSPAHVQTRDVSVKGGPLNIQANKSAMSTREDGLSDDFVDPFVSPESELTNTKPTPSAAAPSRPTRNVRRPPSSESSTRPTSSSHTNRRPPTRRVRYNQYGDEIFEDEPMSRN